MSLFARARRRRLLGGLTLAALVPARVRAQSVTPTEEGAYRRGWPARRPAPEVSLPAWDGSVWTLSAQRGQVVVLNFWASWCDPCRAEMPSLERLAVRHRPDRLQVVTVNFRETDAALRRFLAATPLALPILRDTDGEVTKTWGVRAFPSTALIGRDGRVAFVVTGEVDWAGAEARRWIEPLIKA